MVALGSRLLQLVCTVGLLAGAGAAAVPSMEQQRARPAYARVLNTDDSPMLDGVFAAIDNDAVLQWNQSQWMREVAAMRRLNLRFFVIPHLARPTPGTNVSRACPLGTFESFFPLSAGQIACLHARPGQAQLAATRAIRAAVAHGMHVHLGLASARPYKEQMQLNYSDVLSRTYAAMQVAILHHLYALFHDDSGTLAGFYTEVEESNFHSWKEHLPRLAANYLAPLAHAIKSLDERLLAWASPYSIGNFTRYSSTDYLAPATYAELWGEVFEHLAPDLDFVAPQDAMGADGNSLTNATQFLTAIRVAALRDGQHTTWANIELFRSWPPSCQRTSTHKCPGRHPAPMSRILSQIVAESPIVKAVGGNTVSWEWFTCLSPHGRYIHSDLEKAAAALTNYKEYELYVQNSTR